MKMILHDRIAEEDKPFLFLQKSERVENDVGNIGEAEDRQPPHNRTGKEVGCGCIDDFVTTTRHVILSAYDTERCGWAFPRRSVGTRKKRHSTAVCRALGCKR